MEDIFTLIDILPLIREDSDFIAADKAFRERKLYPSGNIQMGNGGISLEYKLKGGNCGLPSYIHCIVNNSSSSGLLKSHGVNIEIKGLDTSYLGKDLVLECVNDDVSALFRLVYPKLFSKKIYLMKNTRNGYIKIGISNNPEYREKTLQSQEPEIELLFSKMVMFARLEERSLHEKYKDKRLRGEWFDLMDKDITDIIKKYSE